VRHTTGHDPGQCFHGPVDIAYCLPHRPGAGLRSYMVRSAPGYNQYYSSNNATGWHGHPCSTVSDQSSSGRSVQRKFHFPSPNGDRLCAAGNFSRNQSLSSSYHGITYFSLFLRRF